MITDLLAGVCHQLPARSLVVAGVCLPACARCGGFYLGFLVAFLFYLFPSRPRLFLRRPGRAAAWLALAAVLPGGADMLVSSFRGGGLGNWGRYAAALPMGWGTFVLVAGVASFLRWGTPAERRWGIREVAGALPLLVVPLLLPLVGHPLAAAAMAAGTLLGAVAFYALLTYLPFGLFRHGRPSGRPVGRVVIGVICVALALAAMKWGLALVAFSAARTG